MTLAYFLGLILCILFATEIAGNFLFKKAEKPVIATIVSTLLVIVGLICGWFHFGIELIAEWLGAIIAAQLLIDKFINPIMALKSSKKTTT